MKRLLLLFLVCLLLTGCATPVTITPATANPAMDEPTEPVQTGLTVNETVLYCAGGITVTLKKMTTSDFNYEFSFLIENDNTSAVTIDSDYAIVNGVTYRAFLFSEIAGKKKAVETISFDFSALQLAGMAEIASVVLPEFQIRYVDESREEIVSLSFETSSTYEHQMVTDGSVVYKKDDISIWHSAWYNDMFGEKAVLLVRNDTERSIIIQEEYVSIDGFVINSLVSDTIYPDTYGFVMIEISDYDLEQIDIYEFSELSFVLEISDAETFRDIDKTQEITLTK